MSEQLTYIHRYEPGEGPHADTTLLLLHGTGGNEDDLQSLGRMVLPGAGQLRPRGNVLENGMPRFFRRFAEGVLDVEDLKARSGELATFIAQASVKYGFDASRVIAAGFSNGANIAASLLLLQPAVLKAAILLHPMVPFVPEKQVNLQGKPIFIGAGKTDPLVPVAQTQELVKIYEDAGAIVTLCWQDGGHGVGIEEVREAKAWVEKL